jgi:hypothetical protein
MTAGRPEPPRGAGPDRGRTSATADGPPDDVPPGGRFVVERGGPGRARGARCSTGERSTDQRGVWLAAGTRVGLVVAISPS